MLVAYKVTVATGLTSPNRRRAPPVLRRLAAVFAIAAVLLNSVVVQVHIEANAPQAWAERSISAASPVGGGAPLKAVCAICQVAAFSGGVVLEPAPALALPATLALHTETLSDRSAISVRPSHAWQSRAPPALV